MSDPAALSLAAAAQALRARHLSSRELADACLARLVRWQPRITAFISVEQRPADEGVPLAHKDMFYRKGRVSNCGSKIRRGWIAQETSTALSRLDSAGMPQIGTLNMAEFAYGPTGHNEHWGDCRNPWNPDYITGGSSSGSGAAVPARPGFGAPGLDHRGSGPPPPPPRRGPGLKTHRGPGAAP